MREEDLEEIAENIEGNLEEDVKSSTSKADIPKEEEDNLNESSGEEEEMYSWDELEYKVNYICFISNELLEPWLGSTYFLFRLRFPYMDSLIVCPN